MSLSPTEIRVLTILTEGIGQKEAAARLRISDQTVKNHCSSAYHKLGVTTLVGAYRVLGWLNPSGVTDIEQRVFALRAEVEQLITDAEAVRSALATTRSSGGHPDTPDANGAFIAASGKRVGPNRASEDSGSDYGTFTVAPV